MNEIWREKAIFERMTFLDLTLYNTSQFQDF